MVGEPPMTAVEDILERMAAVYDWYRQGMALLAAGDAHAAATVLERVAKAEPDKGSAREALARAYFGARQFGAALEEFTAALDISPVNDYAHFGAGLCLGRLGRTRQAIGHLRMACVMRPGNSDYEGALARYEARARVESGAPGGSGGIPTD